VDALTKLTINGIEQQYAYADDEAHAAIYFLAVRVRELYGLSEQAQLRIDEHEEKIAELETRLAALEELTREKQ